MTHSEADTADYGLRFVLVAFGPGGVTEVARSRGMADSEWLEPVFFGDGDCQFVLADTGAETSWGLEAFRLCHDSLTALGPINVSLPAGDASTEVAENPLPFARMRRDSSGVVVEFGTDLVLWITDPSTRAVHDSIVNMEEGRPITFRLAGGSFHRMGRE
ncbi:hypothetical protein [Longimicrobium terrae]|uniref:Uncharacterized protein n=1 Tax=Longimicrobium terrae TaxID=1639882 RepID=A0A841H746_9BACT|nr:hypothetical protein [Longimicrobium terrae]MBB4639616.1 hypothetical protein [Longimicrobium terrae]MBB6073981.1 hypothetical protein [Longimicrobium terrae]NNC28301.1 hypothetical protein [Longimicrobium terrae]